MKFPKGIHLRAFVGTLVVLIDLWAFYANHIKVIALYTKEELIMHGLLLVAGLLLIAPQSILAAWNAVKDKIPVLGAKK